VVVGITGDLAEVVTFDSRYRLEQRGLLSNRSLDGPLREAHPQATSSPRSTRLARACVSRADLKQPRRAP